MFWLTVLLLIGAQNAGSADRTMADINRYRGLDFHIDDIGASVGAFTQWGGPRLQYGLYAGWLTITEQTYYDYWGYPHKLNEISLDFIKTGLIVKYPMFRGMLDNSFSPFVSAQGGLAIGLDTPEYTDFFKKFKQMESIPGYYGGMYFGIDFKMSGRSALSVAAGFETHNLNRVADGKASWGGKSVTIQLGTFSF